MRWGKPTKNKKRRDPRYFLNEGTELNEGLLPFKMSTVEYILNQIELAIGEVIRSDDTNLYSEFWFEATRRSVRVPLSKAVRLINAPMGFFTKQQVENILTQVAVAIGRFEPGRDGQYAKAAAARADQSPITPEQTRTRLLAALAYNKRFTEVMKKYELDEKIFTEVEQPWAVRRSDHQTGDTWLGTAVRPHPERK